MSQHYKTPKPPHHPIDTFVPPQRVDKFRLLRPLGRGGMGQVFLAHDEMLERQVALKFIATIRPGAEQRERFLIEARAIARIHHPNVVAIYSVGEHDGMPYLVSEFIEGCSLAQIEKPLPYPKVLQIALELARGLDAAHQRGVLHRDIKPGNILLSKNQEVKLVDFGLAKLLQDSFVVSTNLAPVPATPPPQALRLQTGKEDQAQTISLVERFQEQLTSRTGSYVPDFSAITHPGARLGTPLYMAPELWRGEHGTVRSDIYSLGAVLYELACGRPPHEAQSTAQLECLVIDTDAIPMAARAHSLDSQLGQIIDACLRRNSTERPGSAAELCAQLEALRLPDEVATVPEGNPYRGLRPFEPTDRGLLFGRRQDVASVIDQLRMQPFVLVTGDSGVGKSSLCRAGVLPTIRDGALNEGRNWTLISLSPGRWPLHAMADALAPLLRLPHGDLVRALENDPAKLTVELSRKLGSHYGLLLFIDQLEEVVTQSSPEDARVLGEFLSHLTQRLPGVRILAAVRGDFLTRLAERTHLSYELSHAVYLLRPLATPDLREVIEGPARIKGVRFENESMVDSMVRSTESAQGGLPLLQFTLAQLWEKRDLSRGIIQESSLKEIGGVEGSLSSYTQAVLSRMLPEQVEAARRILIRLVRSDETRISRSEEELVTGDPAEPIALDMLVQSRLLVAKRQTASTNTYELAHEALLAGWSQLREWLSHDREQRAVLERAEAAAQEWERFGHRPDLLWREPQIIEFDRVCTREAGVSRVQSFLMTSRKVQKRQLWIRRSLLCLALCGVAAIAIAAVRMKEDAEVRESHSNMQIRQKVNQAGKENEAIQEALGLYRRHQARGRVPGEVQETLLEVMMTAGKAYPGLEHGSGVRWVTYSPDGNFLASASDDHTARLWDANDGSCIRILAGHQQSVAMVEFSRDGSLIVTASGDGTAILWKGATGEQLHSLSGHTAAVTAAHFSPDGLHVLTISEDGTAIVWDVATGRSLHRLRGSSVPVRTCAFSPDGAQFATGGDDMTIRVWSSQSGSLLRTLLGHKGRVNVLNYSPKGDQLVSGSDDMIGRVWDTETGKLLSELREHRSPVVVAEFSQDGSRVLTAASNDVAARVWDAGTGVRLMKLDGHSSQLLWAVYSKDGTRIATMGTDHIVRLWHATTGTQLAAYRGHTSEVLHAAFSPNGQRLATAGQDRKVHVWMEHRANIKNLALHRGPVWGGAIAPDGRTIVTVSGDTFVRLWEAATGHLINTLSGHGLAVTEAAFSPDGRWLATVGLGQRDNAFLWNMKNLSQRLPLSGHADRVQRVSFSKDGTRLLTVSYDHTARVWEVPSGRELFVLKGEEKLFHGTFSPDGLLIVTGETNGTARIWDARTGLCRHILSGHTKAIWFAGFSPDGKWIATTAQDNSARLWDANTGRSVHILLGHSDWVIWAAFSPDSKTLVTVSHDGTGAAWGVMSGERNFLLTGHREAIWSCQFSPDGRQILTGSADQTARLWSSTSGSSLGVLRGHLANITSLAFAPDGKTALTFSTDGTARIYPVRLEDWVNETCNYLRRWPNSQVTASFDCPSP